MARKVNKSFGFVRLREVKTGVWKVQYRDPQDGHYVRRRIPASTYEEAERMAIEQNEAIKADRGFLPEIRQSEQALALKNGPTVKEAVLECINASRGSGETKYDYVFGANLFLRWLGEHFANLTHWRDVRPLHLSRFVRHLERKDKSPSTIRLYLFPVKSTARYMALNYPDKGFIDVGVTVKPPAQRKGQPQVLSAQDVSAFLDHVAENDPQIAPTVMLQALCGLRIREALALREQDVDFTRKAITLTDTPMHSVKTMASERTLPVPERVWIAVREHIASMKIRHIDGYLFLSKGNHPWTDNGYSHRVKRNMRDCGRNGGPSTLERFAPRRLRATFCTLAYQLGGDDRLIKRYLGHSSRDVMGDHYLRIDVEDLRCVAGLFNGDWVELSGSKGYSHCTKIARAVS